jgi:hypothetical protein
LSNTGTSRSSRLSCCLSRSRRRCASAPEPLGTFYADHHHRSARRRSAWGFGSICGQTSRSCAVIVAGAFLAARRRGPISSIVLMVELTHKHRCADGAVNARDCGQYIGRALPGAEVDLLGTNSRQPVGAAPAKHGGTRFDRLFIERLCFGFVRRGLRRVRPGPAPSARRQSPLAVALRER